MCQLATPWVQLAEFSCIFCQIQEPTFTRVVVNPVDAFQVVAESRFLPATAKVVAGQGVLPFEISGHEGNHPRITREFVERLQRIEDRHVWPHVGLSFDGGAERFGSEPAVIILPGEDSIDPLRRVCNDPRVVEHVTQVAVSLEPVGEFFPVIFAAGGDPAVVFEFQERGDFIEPAAHAVGLQFQHVPEPSLRFDAADRQLHERTDAQGRFVRNVQWGWCNRWDGRYDGKVCGVRGRCRYDDCQYRGGQTSACETFHSIHPYLLELGAAEVAFGSASPASIYCPPRP